MIRGHGRGGNGFDRRNARAPRRGLEYTPGNGPPQGWLRATVRAQRTPVAASPAA